MPEPQEDEGEERWWIAYHAKDAIPPADAVIIRAPNVLPGCVTVRAESSQAAHALFKLGAKGKESVNAERGPFPSAEQAQAWESY